MSRVAHRWPSSFPPALPTTLDPRIVALLLHPDHDRTLTVTEVDRHANQLLGLGDVMNFADRTDSYIDLLEVSD